jgi:hypothetical protein
LSQRRLMTTATSLDTKHYCKTYAGLHICRVSVAPLRGNTSLFLRNSIRGMAVERFRCPYVLVPELMAIPLTEVT